jgi:predicted nuclease of predicted toxin-antitoxin system
MALDALKLFIDESLSPSLARWLNEQGLDAVHPLHVGRLGDPDHVVLRRCIDGDRAIVTTNARDFRRLVGRSELHAGLIILPPTNREQSLRQLQSVLEYLDALGNPADTMVNHVVEVAADGAIPLHPLPQPAN